MFSRHLAKLAFQFCNLAKRWVRDYKTIKKSFELFTNLFQDKPNWKKQLRITIALTWTMGFDQFLLHICYDFVRWSTVKWKLVNQNINTVISRVWFPNGNVLVWNEHICWRSKVSYHLFTHKCKGKIDMLLKHNLSKTHIIYIHIQRIIMKKNKLSNLDLKSAL